MDDRLKPDYVYLVDRDGKRIKADLPIKDITEDVKPNPYHIGEHLGDGDMKFLRETSPIDAVGYIPPITLFYKDYAMQMEKRIEETVLKAVSEIGVDIDKERLIKILEGDRQSYEDGYRNGFVDGQSKWEKTRWWVWLKNLIGNDRRTFVCGKYRHCEDCLVYKPCMVEHTEEDFHKNREEFDKAIDEWLDTEIEEGDDGESNEG